MTVTELAELELLIKKARLYEMTQKEIEEQSVHWVIGNASEGPRPTESEVKAALVGLPA